MIILLFQRTWNSVFILSIYCISSKITSPLYVFFLSVIKLSEKCSRKFATYYKMSIVSCVIHYILYFRCPTSILPLDILIQDTGKSGKFSTCCCVSRNCTNNCLHLLSSYHVPIEELYMHCFMQFSTITLGCLHSYYSHFMHHETE